MKALKNISLPATGARSDSLKAGHQTATGPRNFMKKILLTTVLLTAFAWPALAQQPKIGVVDMNKVFESFYKTKAAKATLKDYVGELEKTGQEMLDEVKKVNEEYSKALASSSDQAVSAEEREKSKKVAESKLKEAQEKENSVQMFKRRADAQVSEKRRQMFEKILDEIRTVVNAEGKSAGCTIVLDSTAETPGLTPIVLYHNGDNDLTGVVLTRLNTTAPAPSPSAADDKKK
jgi:outer membrane protein